MNEPEIQQSVKKAKATIAQAEQLLLKAGASLAEKQRMYSAAGFTPESFSAYLRKALPEKFMRDVNKLEEKELRDRMHNQPAKPELRNGKKLPTNFI